MARLSPARGRLFVLGSVLGMVAVLGLSVAPAMATTYYDNDGCVVRQLIDGPPAGGSQCAGVNLGSKSLGQAALQGANLAGTNFSGSKLQAANFTGANIAGANFTNSQVDGADFTNTGILPGTIAVPATSAAGAAITFAPQLPEGLTDGGCFVAEAPVASGTVFPVGSSGLLCKFIGAKGNGIAVLKIVVTALPTVAPTASASAAAAASAGTAPAATRATTNWGLIGGVGGAALLVLAVGVTAIMLSRRNPGAALVTGAFEAAPVPEAIPEAPAAEVPAIEKVVDGTSLLDELIAFGGRDSDESAGDESPEGEEAKPGL